MVFRIACAAAARHLLPHGNSNARWQQVAIALAVFVLGMNAVRSPLIAADPPNKPSTAKSSRDEAIHSIPFAKFAPEVREKISTVINDASLYRRLPIQVVDCEPDLFQFVVNNPDVMVNIWQLMGVTNVTLDRTDADRFRCSDGDGTTARVEIVSRSHDTQVIYAEGNYDGPLFPKAVRGQCVIVLKYASVRESNGRYYETVRLDTFLRVENMGVELLAKLFQGMVGKTIDHNFAETVAFLGSMSHTSEVNPRGMQRLAARMNHVAADRREQFVGITDRVAEKLASSDEPADASGNAVLTDVVQSSAAIVAPTAAKR